MQNFPHPPSGSDDRRDEPEPSDRLDTVRMPGAVVFALVVVCVHALGNAVGGWAILDENYSKQEHGQELILPMFAAWFVALLSWALAALQTVCVVLARKRRSWVRTALAASMILAAVAAAFGFLASLAAGAPSIVVLVILVVDAAALWVVLGEAGRRWFSVRGTEPASPPGGDRP